MANNELHEAAERLRRMRGLELCEVIYPGGDWERQCEDDTELVIDAHLAKHPPDDDEPIMGDWLREIGLSQLDSANWPITNISEPIWIELEKFEGWSVWLVTLDETPVRLRWIETRGQLRRLMSALGTETGKGSAKGGDA